MNQKRQKINHLPDRFRCFEVSVPNDEGERAYALLDHLTGLPIVSIAVPESTHTQLCAYFPYNARRVMIDGISKDFHAQFSAPCSIKTYLLRDWKEKWKRALAPKKVTPHLWVCPSWKTVRAKKGERVIRLDPGLAFGTGLHPTTRFVLKMIDRFRGDIASLIDIGTGSGILAIGATLLGIQRISAIDCDPSAIETARENLKRNRIASVRLIVSSLEAFQAKSHFDFIAANLETNILLRSKGRLITLLAPGGYLTMTGIGTRSRSEVLRHYRSRDLKLMSQFKGREWSGFCFQKFPS